MIIHHAQFIWRYFRHFKAVCLNNFDTWYNINDALNMRLSPDALRNEVLHELDVHEEVLNCLELIQPQNESKHLLLRLVCSIHFDWGFKQCLTNLEVGNELCHGGAYELVNCIYWLFKLVDLLVRELELHIQCVERVSFHLIKYLATRGVENLITFYFSYQVKNVSSIA